MKSFTAGGRKSGRSSGQMRIVELTIAVFMVVSIMLLVVYFTRPLRSIYIRETSDLRRFAFNTLNNFADAGVFERIVSSALNGDRSWEGRLRMLTSASLPPGVVFHMEVYAVDVFANATVKFRRLDSGGISNVDEVFNPYESETVNYTYACVRDPDNVRGVLLYIVMVIGYAN
ncbi:MAG: hypothetical protein N3E41_05745 [Thermofilaceae archaeon]|nr:hypothetical protein [Thermofilaceae archaeon]MDW8005011.1 hypothetical protein [Thermofilaceae archaeon]